MKGRTKMAKDRDDREEEGKIAKYKIIYYWTDGSEEEDDNYGEYYSSEEEANEAGLYELGCAIQGGEILAMSNPGDYPFDDKDYEDDSFEVMKVD